MSKVFLSMICNKWNDNANKYFMNSLRNNISSDTNKPYNETVQC